VEANEIPFLNPKSQRIIRNPGTLPNGEDLDYENVNLTEIELDFDGGQNIDASAI